MSRIKGKYIAIIDIDLDVERDENRKSFEEIEDNFVSGKLTDAIKYFITLNADDGVDVDVKQIYAKVTEDDGL